MFCFVLCFVENVVEINGKYGPQQKNKILNVKEKNNKRKIKKYQIIVIIK